MSSPPLLPAGTTSAFARARPSGEFKIETSDNGPPCCHTSRYGNGSNGRTVKFSRVRRGVWREESGHKRRFPEKPHPENEWYLRPAPECRQAPPRIHQSAGRYGDELLRTLHRRDQVQKHRYRIACLVDGYDVGPPVVIEVGNRKSTYPQWCFEIRSSVTESCHPRDRHRINSAPWS